VGGVFGPYQAEGAYGLYRDAWERLRAGGWSIRAGVTAGDRELAVSAPAEDEENDEPNISGYLPAQVGSYSPMGARANRNGNWRFEFCF